MTRDEREYRVWSLMTTAKDAAAALKATGHGLTPTERNELLIARREIDRCLQGKRYVRRPS